MLKCCLEQLSLAWQPYYPSGSPTPRCPSPDMKVCSYTCNLNIVEELLWYHLTHMDSNLSNVCIKQKMPTFHSGSRAVKNEKTKIKFRILICWEVLLGESNSYYYFLFFFWPPLCHVSSTIAKWNATSSSEKGRSTMSLIVSSKADRLLIFLNFKKTVHWLLVEITK